MTTGAVTGLVAEARIARRLGLVAAAGGGSAVGTESAIAALLAQGVSGLVSFGIAGGLAPALAGGTLVLPAALRTIDGEGFWVDVAWHQRLVRAARGAGLRVVVGGMLAAGKMAATCAEKAALHEATSAVAVDLESHRVALAAARARVPFVVVRVIADPASRELPPAARVPLTRRGRANLPCVLASIAARPGQVPALIELAREHRAALEALLRGGRALGADLARV